MSLSRREMQESDLHGPMLLPEFLHRRVHQREAADRGDHQQDATGCGLRHKAQQSACADPDLPTWRRAPAGESSRASTASGRGAR